MIVNKEQIILSLQEKANTKLEQLRHEMAQQLFDLDEVVKPNNSLVIDGKTYQTVAFKSQNEANSFMEKNEEWGFLAEKGGVFHLAKIEELGEAAPNLQAGNEPGLDINQAFKTFNSSDEVMSYFAKTISNAEQVSFNNVTGEFSLKGSVLAVKGKDGSFSVDVTAVANRGLAMSGSEAGKNPARYSEEQESKKANALTEGKAHFERTLADGTVFRVVNRDTSGMPGTQDAYEMQLIDIGGKKYSLGSHPSVKGAEAFFNHRVMHKSMVDLKKSFSYMF